MLENINESNDPARDIQAATTLELLTRERELLRLLHINDIDLAVLQLITEELNNREYNLKGQGINLTELRK